MDAVFYDRRRQRAIHPDTIGTATAKVASTAAQQRARRMQQILNTAPTNPCHTRIGASLVSRREQDQTGPGERYAMRCLRSPRP